MKKYKLIKQYKGSPELGIIVTVNNDGTIQVPIGSIGTLIHGKPSDYSQYWEEIIEKDYEILSCKHFMTGGIYAIGQTFLSNEGYRKFNELDINRINCQDGTKVYSIYSVKRLSDGEIFTIGDECITYSRHYGKIKLLEIYNDKLYVKSDQNVSNAYTCEIKDLKPVKTPLFTTEESVDIYEGGTYYVIDDDASIVFERKAEEQFNSRYTIPIKRFAVKENAEKYIFYNAKSLSLNDLIDNKDHHMSASTLIKKCENLIRNNK